MITSIFGCVGKSSVRVGGESTEDGFRLTIYKRFEGSPVASLFFKTSHYDGIRRMLDVSSALKNHDIVLVVGTISLSLCAASLLLLSPQKLWTARFLAMIFILFVSFIVTRNLSIFFYIARMPGFSNLKEWHACEHKIVTLIEDGRIPTRRNMKKAPMTLINCGTSIVINSTQQHISMLVLIFYMLGIIPFSAPLVTGFLFFFLSCIFLSLYIAVFGNYLRLNPVLLIVSAIFLFPALILPMLGERILLLKHPSEEKIEAAVTEMYDFITEHTEIWRFFHPQED
ncbi:MAG: hypothetical protein COU47_02715 [Candidatus Niyogibacteria bacterium CG10_big_fil_rev_8_21_14_0_10_46_36]|uniref:Uncharacterized protein n=1 Tax=Candidatus Niyogibacteria bacterium CG10_big_fil_rev_8_21_14_0_10_46_36 TaxID=1974726 RepID=A0A2H0TD29_9BACT|nr:MAG: hypothetical protein COU47_02715 [Candidatus Niyogibacteria bacterium CG10_big_fil_rev_8_21_14_0_10_46_36]